MWTRYTVADISKTIRNTKTSFSLQVALLHLIMIDSLIFVKSNFVLDCDIVLFVAYIPYVRKSRRMKFTPVDTQRQKCNQSVSQKCRFSEFGWGKTPNYIMQRHLIGYHCTYSAPVGANVGTSPKAYSRKPRDLCITSSSL